jgi:hypothetical protein
MQFEETMREATDSVFEKINRRTNMVNSRTAYEPG